MSKTPEGAILRARDWKKDLSRTPSTYKPPSTTKSTVVHEEEGGGGGREAAGEKEIAKPGVRLTPIDRPGEDRERPEGPEGPERSEEQRSGWNRVR